MAERGLRLPGLSAAAKRGGLSTAGFHDQAALVPPDPDPNGTTAEWVPRSPRALTTRILHGRSAVREGSVESYLPPPAELRADCRATALVAGHHPRPRSGCSNVTVTGSRA